MTETLSVQQAIAAIIGKLPAIEKSHENKQQGFKFRSVDDVLSGLKPLLSEYGVLIVPNVQERIAEERTTKSGSTMNVVHLRVLFTLFGPKGDHVQAQTWGEGSDSGDKATNKAMTSAYKYALFQTFCVAGALQDSDAETPQPTMSKRDALVNSVGERLKTVLAGDVDAIKLFLQNYFGDAYTGRLADLDDSELERLRVDLEEEDGAKPTLRTGTPRTLERPPLEAEPSSFAQATLVQDKSARSIEDVPLPEPGQLQITDDQRDDLIRSADRKGLDLGLWLAEHGIKGPLSEVPSERASELLKEIHALPDPAQESLPVDENGWAKDEPEEKKKTKVK